MNSKERLAEAREIMLQFAKRTALDSREPAAPLRQPRRYLWTDAFAVSNFLVLWRESGERRYTDLALALVDQVHQVLGRRRPGGPGTPWLSGLDEEEGQRHPTRGGLRIGKREPERAVGEALDERREWDRDGQYFHYLTRWMRALDQVSRHTRRSHFNLWARELAHAAHRAFVHVASGQGRRMFWKMSTDLSRPLVTAMGQHDALDGLITCTELQATAAIFPAAQAGPEVEHAVRDFASMLEGQELSTSDPLGLGGLLLAARRVSDLMKGGAFANGVLLDSLLVAAERGLSTYVWHPDLLKPAEQRLAFRELGLVIGSSALLEAGRDIRAASERRAHSTMLALRLSAIESRQALGSALGAFWLEPRHRSARSWLEHQDINDVMLATSLLPHLGELP